MSDEFVLMGPSDRTLLLGDSNAAEWPELTLAREVLEPHPPSDLWLITGTHTGLVGIRLTYHPSKPVLDSRSWPHHDVAHLYLGSATLQAIPPMGEGDLAKTTTILLTTARSNT